MAREQSAEFNCFPALSLNMNKVPGDLHSLLTLAARYHLGGLALCATELQLLLDRIKESAKLELEPGDGLRIESVRVERKLDGSVAMFFGI